MGGKANPSEIFDGFALSISVVPSKDEVDLAGRGTDYYPHNLERVSSNTSINRDWLDCFRSRYSIFVTSSPYLIYLSAQWIADDVYFQQGILLARTTKSFLPFPLFPLFNPHFSLFPKTSPLTSFEERFTTVSTR